MPFDQAAEPPQNAARGPRRQTGPKCGGRTTGVVKGTAETTAMAMSWKPSVTIPSCNKTKSRQLWGYYVGTDRARLARTTVRF